MSALEPSVTGPARVEACPVEAVAAPAVPDPDSLMEDVAFLVDREPQLSPLDAGVLLALAYGIARDTRAFARLFGIAHALVLRAASDLEDGLGLVVVEQRQERSMRSHLRLSDLGRHMLAQIGLMDAPTLSKAG
ncbi:hypothetical protein MWN34_02715 [Ancylobacter sp. 6x-1]|uniref:MarR family transcriptional regulator n=1 Tax=Ancylobacter crimeensis TaxID=2579147 RepID=A0ABT0D7A6_9HYPH|nr:hypothetical protein [Ancylobacter crimeensis]MCK0195814.1 hypothetical protein [Ancylobacter crimeensis]